MRCICTILNLSQSSANHHGVKGYGVSMHCGELLKHFRKKRQFTLRDLGKLSGLDHAYIHRLETGEETAPSEDTVKALPKALKLDSRKAHMLKCLIKQPVPASVVEIVLEEPQYALDDFAFVMTMGHRSMRPKINVDWKRLLARVREIREECENGDRLFSPAKRGWMESLGGGG